MRRDRGKEAGQQEAPSKMCSVEKPKSGRNASAVVPTLWESVGCPEPLCGSTCNRWEPFITVLLEKTGSPEGVC